MTGTPLPAGWQQVRAAVLLADGFTCRWCIAPAQYVLRVHPARPFEPRNLISLCAGCKPVHEYHQREAARSDGHFRHELAKPVDRPVTQSRGATPDTPAQHRPHTACLEKYDSGDFGGDGA